MQELEQAKVIEAYAKREIRAAVAAKRLQISTRHVRRLKERFLAEGAPGMVSGRRGKPSNNRLPLGVAQRAIELVREHYPDFGPTLAAEMLCEHHGLMISKEALRRLMIEAGSWIPRAARQAALHQPRERRACLGELVQIDGSRHAWFEQRAPECALLVYVDDATGRIMQLHFADTESTTSYFEASRRYIERHGKPRAFYADRAAVFRSASATTRGPTQFQRALDDLGITLICANSPQAKGKVERANRTLQDRLVKQLRLEGIDSIAAANAWCDGFVERYNERFAKVARSEIDAHVPCRPTDDLPRILAIQETRKLSAKLTIQYDRRVYLLCDAPDLRELIGQPMGIYKYADGEIELRANGNGFAYTVQEAAKRAGPIDVDSKTLPHTMDEHERNRNYRQQLTATMIRHGVIAAKQMSAQKALRGSGG